jgi:hypothetical protein
VLGWGVLLPLWGDGSRSFLLPFYQVNYPGFAVGKIAAKTCMTKLFYQMVGSHRKNFSKGTY